MGKVMTTFRRAEVREQGPDPAPRRLDRAFGGVAEQRFELSEDLFNRVEIGRIRRQEAQRGPRSLKGLRTAGPLWLLRLSIMTISPGVRVGSRHCST